MDVALRIERGLEQAVGTMATPACPPRLAAALRHAVFPGGARVRPRLTLAVADACGDPCPSLSVAAASAVELLHCASLVQDDLGCFDDAATRRGRPSVHVAFDERLAILASDALIVAAFEQVSAIEEAPDAARLAIITLLSRRVGAAGGITAGQAWEAEPDIPLEAYHQAKTGSLFAAATELGALAAGADPSAWSACGARIGAAYQIADDLQDVLGDAGALGKPVQVDARHDRPNAATRLGVDHAVGRLESLIDEIVDAVPSCLGATRFVETVRTEAMRFMPNRSTCNAA